MLERKEPWGRAPFGVWTLPPRFLATKARRASPNQLPPLERQGLNVGAPVLPWLPGPPPDRKKREEQRGPRESLVSRPRAQPSVEEKQPQPSGANLGADGTLQIRERLGSRSPDSELQIPVPCLRQCRRCHNSFQDLRWEPRAMGAAKVLVSKRASGNCDA